MINRITTSIVFTIITTLVMFGAITTITQRSLPAGRWDRYGNTLRE
jgi:hypothetical protein